MMGSQIAAPQLNIHCCKRRYSPEGTTFTMYCLYKMYKNIFKIIYNRRKIQTQNKLSKSYSKYS